MCVVRWVLCLSFRVFWTHFIIYVFLPPLSCEQIVESVLWVRLPANSRARPEAGLVSPSPCKGNRRENCAAHPKGLRPAPERCRVLPPMRMAFFAETRILLLRLWVPQQRAKPATRSLCERFDLCVPCYFSLTLSTRYQIL